MKDFMAGLIVIYFLAVIGLVLWALGLMAYLLITTLLAMVDSIGLTLGIFTLAVGATWALGVIANIVLDDKL